MIRISNLNKCFDKDRIVLNNINLIINDSDYISIRGKSGAGKTTLLHILGLIENFDGEYLIDNIQVKELNEKELAKIRRDKFGYVFQFFNLDKELTTFENIETPFIICKKKKKEYKDKIDSLLKELSIYEYRNKKVANLSGGEAQRVAIAMAIANDAKIILADEPTGSLDKATADIIMDIFDNLNKKGVTIVLVTHDDEIANRAKRKLILKDGTLIEQDNI